MFLNSTKRSFKIWQAEVDHYLVKNDHVCINANLFNKVKEKAVAFARGLSFQPVMA